MDTYGYVIFALILICGLEGLILGLLLRARGITLTDTLHAGCLAKNEVAALKDELALLKAQIAAREKTDAEALADFNDRRPIIPSTR